MMENLTYHRSLSTLHVGCVDPHAYLIPYQSVEAAKTGDRTKSDRFVSLCGEWNFRYFPSERELGDFLAPHADAGEWDRLTVPMSWQFCTDRDYDKPQYTNLRYPFPADPPHLPAEIPCGLYEREFDVDAQALETYDIRLHFEGVDSCFYLYINGRFAAYSQVSHMTSEIDVTEFLHAGKNQIKVLVLTGVTVPIWRTRTRSGRPVSSARSTCSCATGYTLRTCTSARRPRNRLRARRFWQT